MLKKEKAEELHIAKRNKIITNSSGLEGTVKDTSPYPGMLLPRRQAQDGKTSSLQGAWPQHSQPHRQLYRAWGLRCLPLASARWFSICPRFLRRGTSIPSILTSNPRQAGQPHGPLPCWPPPLAQHSPPDSGQVLRDEPRPRPAPFGDTHVRQFLGKEILQK